MAISLFTTILVLLKISFFKIPRGTYNRSFTRSTGVMENAFVVFLLFVGVAE